MRRGNDIVMAAVFVLGAAAYFILSTVLMDEAADSALVAVAAVGAFLLALAADTPTRARLRALDRRMLVVAAVGGVLVAFVAPTIVYANRFTDAPPGSETLFFTTAAWGLLGVVGARILRWGRPSAEQMVFALVGLLGVAALVANWERPSSFSPMIRYARYEFAFLLAGVCWVAGSLLLQGVLRGPGRKGALTVAAGSAALAAVVYALLTSGLTGITDLGPIAPAAFGLAIAFGALFVAWFRLVPAVGVGRASGLWFLPAIVITASIIYEQAVSPRGPDPVIWVGALGGMAVAALGAIGVWFATHGPREHRGLSSYPLLPRISGLLAAFAIIFGAISLVMPAFEASVTGTLTDGQTYSVAWEMMGYESAGGWIPLLAGALLLAASFGALGGPGAGRTGLVAASSAIAIAAYALVASTPLHTWNRWVPSKIQSEYGSEYALIEFATIHDPVRIAALWLGAAAALVLLVHAYVRWTARTKADSAPSEVLA